MKLNEKQIRQGENPIDQTAITTKNRVRNENKDKKNKMEEQQKERNNQEDM